MHEFECSAEDLKRRLGGGEPLRLIDCREPWEFELVRLEGAELIPMNETPGRIEEYRSADVPVVVYCHHGVRSMNVVGWLRDQGLKDVWSLAGGIDRWSLTIDPSVPRY